LQSPQFDVEFSGVSQPFVSGAADVQSFQPDWQPVYLQVAVPLVEHDAPELWVESQATPQLPQFWTVLTAVSQPFVFGGVVLQSLKPAAQLEYVQLELPALQVAPVLWAVSHDCPQALHVAEATCVSQPS
jgi:hypothetical protein